MNFDGIFAGTVYLPSCQIPCGVPLMFLKPTWFPLESTPNRVGCTQRGFNWRFVMAVYVVAYDLKVLGQNYECVTKRLKAFDHWHAQGSVWFVDCPGSEATLREALQTCLDSNDRLFISEVSRTWAGKNMPSVGSGSTTVVTDPPS